MTTRCCSSEICKLSWFQVCKEITCRRYFNEDVSMYCSIITTGYVLEAVIRLCPAQGHLIYILFTHSVVQSDLDEDVYKITKPLQLSERRRRCKQMQLGSRPPKGPLGIAMVLSREPHMGSFNNYSLACSESYNVVQSTANTYRHAVVSGALHHYSFTF